MFLKVFRLLFRSNKYLRCMCFFIILLVIFAYKSNNIHYDDSSQNFTLLSEGQFYMNAPKIFNYIQSVNIKEKIKNLDTFGAITKDTIVLVILLDKFSSGLKFVISSLNEVKGIEQVLVIFSHSYFDENINRAITGIDFCRVMQIYYPYSVQTHPEEFPGYDPSDCSYNLNYKNWRKNCTFSHFLDIRGHFRTPSVAERKHHWWWTANNIFENFSSTAKHTGLVIFSEDNYIFTNDFIYMASYMRDIAKSLPQCEFLSLGHDTTPAEPKILESNDLYSVKVSTWNPNEHSRVLAFDKTVWNSIVSHYDLFCTLDDASWLRSLFYISVRRTDGKKYKTMSAVTPRAFNIHSCSTKLGGSFGYRCSLLENFITIMNIEKLNDKEWFPSHLEVYINVELEDEDNIIFDYSEGNGGWGDPRDWELCRNMTAGKIKKVLMEMRNEFHEYFREV